MAFCRTPLLSGGVRFSKIYALTPRLPPLPISSILRAPSRSTLSSRPLLRTFASNTSSSTSTSTSTSASTSNNTPRSSPSKDSPEGSQDARTKESESDSATRAAMSPREPYSQRPETSSSASSDLLDWEEKPNFDIEKFAELPYTNFGVNQHIIIDQEFKEIMRQLLWRFRAPIRYAFAYGSGVFPQSTGDTPTEAEIKAVHPKAPLAVQKAQNGSPKMIDFIFGVQHTQHFHSLNLRQHRDHYSGLGSLGSAAVSWVQDQWGAGVYFNPYVTVDGVLIKYGVVNIDTLCRDLRDWDTLYIAGRLHKPVKILRDHPQVRLANQINLMGALRTALLMLPEKFTEKELYYTIAGISYLGDPRMAFPTESPRKVANIVDHNMLNFRRLYAPLVESLPNVEFDDPACAREDWVYNTEAVVGLRQDMDPVRRGNMVRRLPGGFRGKLYFEYQRKFQIPQLEFDRMMEASRDEDPVSRRVQRQQGGGFERRIAQDDPDALRAAVRGVIKRTVNWPSTSQSLKGFVTAGASRSARYLGEKIAKYRQAPPGEK